MDSLTHFHSRNVYFYINFSNNLKVTALDMFQKNLGSHPVNSSAAKWMSGAKKERVKRLLALIVPYSF